MKKMFFVLVTAFLSIVSILQNESVIAEEKTPSQHYVEAMGSGWNLGNTFDGFDENDDRREESWGNPRVTRELISTVKEKGFDSIRLPFTAHMRIEGPESDYLIDEEFLTRYEEVVNWSLEEDLYVMINVHHDSWVWLANWDGDTEAEEYIKFVRIWEQLAERFKEYDDRVMFESINEPQFNTGEENSLTYLETLNDVFYEIVRNSGSTNEERMLILPTLLTDTSQERMDALYNQITALEDENIIATIHYYSEWVYSANLGKTRFDGILWDDATPRTSLIEVFDRIAHTFTENGIGVVIGEYGLLGYDKSETVNQFGETLKFLEFINYYAREKGINLMLWDNGQHLNRHTYEWHNSQFGSMIEASMTDRSSYATGLNTVYLSDFIPEDGLSIPLTLNGNDFVSISHEGVVLNEGTDFTYESEVLQLTEDFLTRIYTQTDGETGTEISLVIEFSSGADWYQIVVYSDTPVLEETSGSVSEGITIPTEYNGNHLENVNSRNEEGTVVSNNDWWDFLEYEYEFVPNYEEGVIQLLPDYTRLLSDGRYELSFTFFNGEVIDYQLNVEDELITGTVLLEEPAEEEEDNGEGTEEDNQDNDEGNEEDDQGDGSENNEGIDDDSDEDPIEDESGSNLDNNGENTGNTDGDNSEGNEIISETKDESESVNEATEGERLPSTATSIWTIGLIGTGVLGLGSGLAYYSKKKKQ